MNCEVFFEINGSPEEQQAVALHIAQFLTRLENKGDIAHLDANPPEMLLNHQVGGR